MNQLAFFIGLFISMVSWSWASSSSSVPYSRVGKNKIVHHKVSQTVQDLHYKLTLNHQGKDFTSSVQSLIDRVLTRAGVKFTFTPVLEMIDYAVEDGQSFDVFEIDGNTDTKQVILRGSSGVALSTAFGHYLRYYTNSDYNWEDGGGYSFLSFPTYVEDLPIPAEKERVVFLSKWRYYQNTCTASYSFAWKTWTQWEADIDWMALNGFNLPLAFTGQELVWQKLWRQYGVSDAGLQQYFTGPAFLTWQRMANIRAFAGPLSDSWINQQADLQRQILARYAELGITPVMPAFNGVVPEEMQALFPSANITRLPTWNNFPDEYSCNYILSSSDPLFAEVGKAFLELQFDVFGETAKSHIYNCDTFNENKPSSSDYDYLAGSSSAVYNSMISADPDAVWLMQGWLFVFDKEFWTDDNIHSYLAGVPDNGMIILDLSSEDLPVWDKIAANNKQFIWCMLHNYGGSRALYGNLTLLANDPIEVQKTVPDYFLGTGLTMEAIDQNPVVYELMSEVSHYRTAPNVTEWVESYVTRRYGLNHPDVTAEQKKLAIVAWLGLLENNYEGETPVCHHPCYRRSILTLHPTWDMFQDKSMRSGPLVDVWTALLYTNISNSNRAYTYDLVDVGRQVMANLFYDYYALAQNAYNNKDIASFTSVMTAMLQLIRDWDKLLSSHESYLLGRWIASARQWAKDDEEANLFEFNARNQITLWGNNGEIDDYAAKNWGGLAKGYYYQRWQLLLSSTLQSLKKNETFDLDAYNTKELSIGQTFSEDYSTKFPTEAVGDAWEISKEMHDKYGNGFQPTHMYLLQKDKDIEGNNVIETATWSRNQKQLQHLCEVAYYCIGYTTEGLLKTDSSNLVSKPGVETFLKGKCLAGSKGCGN